MDRRVRRLAVGLTVVMLGLVAGPSRGGPAVTSLDQLVRMTSGQLDALYRQAGPGAVPQGRVRGQALVSPGSRLAVPLSRGARVLWQGKVFHPDDSTAVNRFFGVRMIRGRVYPGSSWLDGRPSLILDYQGTSLVYGNFRDEIRQVGPGLYLGLMYARTSPQPALRAYFAFQSVP